MVLWLKSLAVDITQSQKVNKYGRNVWNEISASNASATQSDVTVVAGYVAQIDDLVTIPLAQISTNLIRTQAIVADHHAFQ